ncbi:hypothetical protein MNBD_GAMMA12-991 [hydrothermal vent metagenome]|uniref:DUF3108 domain-containing protein n=1 Tax=hydrothermal vent metagenome TaxID=652676 RepID=A0A3B0YDZ9_9ZZZZ
MHKIFISTLLSLIASTGFATDKAPFPDFTAEYTLYKAGLRAAVSVVTLKRTSPTSWSYKRKASPVGIVSVFRSDKISDHSDWSLVNNAIQVKQYTFSHKRGSKQKKYNRFVYNWKTNTASSQVKDSKKTIKITPVAIDKFTLQLRIMRDMAQNGKPAAQYFVTDKHKLKSWVFTISGKEKIKIGKEMLDTVILKRTRKNKKRTTYLYLSKKYRYLPVKVLHVEKNGSKFYMLLTKLSGL